MTDEEKKLRGELHAACVKWAKLKEAKRKTTDKKMEAVRELQRKIGEEISDEFDKSIADAENAEAVARLAVQWFEVEETRNRLMFSEGTVLEEWDKPRYLREWKRTGNKGVVEVRTPDSILPEHPGWKVPCVGGVGVRLLKKNGRPGLKLIAVTWGTAWSIEGMEQTPCENMKLLRDSEDQPEL